MRRLLLTGAIVGACLACTSRPPAISGTAAATLGSEVAAVRTAAEAGDFATAQQRVADLRLMVASLQQQGRIRTDRAAAILAAADDVARDIVDATPTTTTTTTTAHGDRHHPKGGPGGGDNGGEGGG